MPSQTHPEADSIRDARTVLVSVDFSPNARAAALRACEFALVCDARVRLLHGLEAKGSVPSCSRTETPGFDPEPSFSREFESWCADLARGAREFRRSSSGRIPSR